jgi:hypothetical protein
MTQAFADAEVARTKSKWVAKAFEEFCRPRTTVRSLFYFAMKRDEPDYPICGGFVGEIRVVRRYHESDGSRLAKWVGKARLLGYIPKDAILDEAPGEHTYLFSPPDIQDELSSKRACRDSSRRTELWINKSSLNYFLLPICQELGINLVSVGKRASNQAVDSLIRRASSPDSASTQVLCLSDLGPDDLFFCDDLGDEISSRGASDKIEIRRLGLTPEQVIELKLPMYPEGAAGAEASADAGIDVSRSKSKEHRSRYKTCLKPHGLNPKHKTELDALEVYYPGGISGFVRDELSSASGLK